MKRILLNCLIILLIAECSAYAVKADNAGNIANFSVQGTTTQGSFVGSPAGTVLTENTTAITLTPYNSQYWDAGLPGGAWLVSLVNVTSTNFIIGFLYIPNNAGYFWLYVFNYTTGQNYWLHFSGQAWAAVGNNPMQPVQVPSLSILATSKVQNQIFINGPNISINGNNGTYDGQEAYAVANVMNVTDAWNELWLLTANYHFVMVYTYFGNSTNVFAGSTLNLNDYSFTPYPDGYGTSLGTWQTTPQQAAPQPVPEFPTTVLLIFGLLIISKLVIKKRRISFGEIIEMPILRKRYTHDISGRTSRQDH